jgi:hypothetical protein
MKKLTPLQTKLLLIIADMGGSYCPPDDLDPLGYRALHELVKAKRLTVEGNDGAPPRYHLTAQGREDASYG